METNKLIKLAVDTVKGVPSAFSEGNPSDVIRNALIEANGGSTKIDVKAMRKTNGSFYELVEELIVASIIEGLPESNPIFKWAETKNGKAGDKPEFKVHKDSVLAVAEVANGTLGIRRQRIFGDTTKTLTPIPHAVKVYEELQRLLAGRADWVDFVNAVSRSFILDTNRAIADAFASIATTTPNVISETGSFSEASMVSLIEKVEMNNPGKTARIFGTKTALRNLAMSTSNMVGETIKDDYYNMGYMGKFNGTDVFELKNGLKTDGTTKILDDTKLYVIATDEQFIKYYNEGDALIVESKLGDNSDLTQDYTVINTYAVAVELADKIGLYDM
jgi:hypothetical protein